LNKQIGFSMVQLLISAMLGLLLSTAVLSTVIAAISSHRLRHVTETVQENIALAEYFITKDMSAIGFKSCFEKSPLLINNLSKGPIGSQFEVFLSPLVTKNTYKKSDSVVFTTVANAGSELEGDMATVHAQLDLVSSDQIKKGQEVFITNCDRADLFKVTDISRNRLSHDYSANSDANLSLSYPQGSLVYPLSLIYYKIARGASGQSGLFRKVDGKQYQELIPNVAQFRVELGVYNTQDKTLKYASTAEKLVNIDVVSVRIYLLLSSATPVLSEKMGFKSFTGDIVKAKDLRFYKAFSIVIALRNADYLYNIEHSDVTGKPLAS